MGTVLVTGAAGFIGSHVTEALLARGDRVTGLDNLNDFYDPALKRRNLDRLAGHADFRFVEGDVRDVRALGRVLEDPRPDAVIHLAAMAGVRPSIERPALYVDVNERGTALLLAEAVRRRIDRFLFASSSSVYGERKDPPFRESDRVDHPVSPYAATKKAGELLCHTFHHLHGLPVTCLRYFTVYGPRQRPEMAIHKFARLILAGRPIPMFGDGSSARDYTYVSDVVDGTIRALDRCGGYRVYNLGGSRMVRLSDLVAILAEALGGEAKVTRLPDQPGDVSLTSACVDLAEAELGYRPAVPIEEGIRRFASWLEEERR